MGVASPTRKPLAPPRISIPSGKVIVAPAPVKFNSTKEYKGFN